MTIYFLRIPAARFGPGLTLIMSLLLTALAAAQTVKSPRNIVMDDTTRISDSLAVGPVIHSLDRTVPNNAFAPGEKLEFKIRYGFIKAGSATMEVGNTVDLDNGYSAYHIITTARSAKFFDAFYEVRDEVQSFVDTRGFFSWKYYKKLREGGYKFDLLVDYDQPRGVAQVERIRYHSDMEKGIRSQSEFQLEIPEYVLDILASFYYIRTQELVVGQPVFMVNHDNKKIYDLEVVVEKKEVIECDAGRFHCIKVEPRLRGEAIFSQKGRMWIWVTDDQYKVPVQVKSKVAVGSITIELEKIHGVPTPLPATIY